MKKINVYVALSLTIVLMLDFNACNSHEDPNSGSLSNDIEEGGPDDDKNKEDAEKSINADESTPLDNDHEELGHDDDEGLSDPGEPTFP